MLINRQISILDLTKLIFLLSSMVQAVLLAKLRYRYLQELQVEAEERRRENFFLAQVNIGPFSKPKWLWWIENIWLCNRRSLKQPETSDTKTCITGSLGGPLQCNFNRGAEVLEGAKLSHNKHSRIHSGETLWFLRIIFTFNLILGKSE